MNTINAIAAESQAGKEYAINITYDPCSLGDCAAILLITNPEGVEYTCLLYGHASAPQPSGPFKIMNGKTLPIDFTNPLLEKADVNVRFDNACFTLQGKPPGTVEPRKKISIVVKFDYNASNPMQGRMIITAKGLPPWSYYLTGEK